MRKRLFADGELRMWLLERIEEVKRHIGTLPSDEIRFSPEAVAETVFGMFAITPLTLHSISSRGLSSAKFATVV